MDYTIGKDGAVNLTEQSTRTLSLDELRERRRFWRDEITRLDETHATQRAEAVARRDEVVALITAVKSAGFEVAE